MRPSPKRAPADERRGMQSGIVPKDVGSRAGETRTDTSGRQVNPESPWLGLKSFTEQEREYFFGRSAEVDELFERVTGHTLTVLFGQSGLGKTSLLNAAILPRLREAGLAPVILRLDHALEALPPEEQVRTALVAAVCPVTLVADSPSLWLLLHDPLYGFCTPTAPRVVLILDQFEEIFTLGQKPARQGTSSKFLSALADLVENRVPQDLRERLTDDEALADRLMYRSRPCRFLLSLRDDYLHRLERSRRVMPSLMDNRMELRRLTGMQAREAVLEPAKLRCREQPELPPIVDEPTADAIVRFVAGVTEEIPLDEIDAIPPLLSLFCAELNSKRGNSAVIHAEQLRGRVDDILASYYERCFDGLDPAVRGFVEDDLLSPEGFRQSANHDTYLHRMQEARVHGAEAQETLRHLIDERLLVSEEHDGIRRIELTHDILAGMARKSREKRLLDRRTLKRLRGAAWAVGLLTLLAFGIVAAGLIITARERVTNARARADVEREVVNVKLAQEEAQRAFDRADEAERRFELQERFQAAQGLALQAREAELRVKQRKLDQSNRQLKLSETRERSQAERVRELGSPWLVTDVQMDLVKGRIPDALAHLGSLLAQRPDLSAAAEQAGYALQAYRVLGSQRVFRGHGDSVESAVFSDDGTRILTASRDRSAAIWNVEVEQPLVRLVGHTARVNSAVFSPDERLIVTAADDNTARLWDAATGVMQGKAMVHTAGVSLAAFSPDGEQVVTASRNGSVAIWDVETSNLTMSMLGHQEEVTAVTYSRDGSLILTGSRDATARLWKVADGSAIGKLSGHLGAITTAVFDRAGTAVLTASTDRTARIWRMNSKNAPTVLAGHGGIINGAAFNIDGSRIVTASADRTLWIWNAETGKREIKLEGHTESVTSAVFSGDNRFVLSASADRTARLWNAYTGEQVVRKSGHERGLTSAVISRDGRWILTGSMDGTARVWEALPRETGLLSMGTQGSHITSASFGVDGKHVATGSTEGLSRVLDTTNGQLRVVAQFKHNTRVAATALSVDDKRVATGDYDGVARVWNIETGDLAVTLSGHKGAVNSVGFNGSGDRVVTASADHTARLWNVNSGETVQNLQGHADAIRYAAFSKDGARVVTASADHTARVWDVKTGEPIAKFDHGAVVVSAAFNIDATLVLTASTDRVARLWSIERREVTIRFSGHTEPLTMAAFGPDGKRILTLSSDATARIWDSETGALLQVLPGHNNNFAAAVFDLDGSRILTAHTDNSLQIWESLQTSQPVPSWFPDMLRYAARGRFDVQGQFETLDGATLANLRREVTKAAASDTSPYGRIGRAYLDLAE